MNIKQIHALAQLVETSGLSVLEVCEGETRIRMEKHVAAPAAEPFVLTEPKPVPVPAKAEAGLVDFNRLTEVTAPMVGVFYAAPTPGAAPFVRRGGRVKKGDVLCIIEAMKLLNEIVAETDGEIADICVENGQVVEFAQVLFKLF